MRGAPAECRRLLDELSAGITDRTVSRLKRVLAGRGEEWRGPFAWSLLLEIAGNKGLAEHGELLGRAAWMACELVHVLEARLTLKPLDYEKLLCNLAVKFRDKQQHTWACCFASLLYERLRLHVGRGEISEAFEGLSLGSEFLATIPKIVCEQATAEEERAEEDLSQLILTCQLLWIGLKMLSPFDVDAIRTMLFEHGGVLAHLQHAGCAERPLELVLHHWRQAILPQEDRRKDVVHLELELFERIGRCDPVDGASVLRERWRNLATYLSLGPLGELQPLWIFDLEQFNCAESFLHRLESLTAETLLCVADWPSVPQPSKQVLRIYASLREAETVKNARITVSLAVDTTKIAVSSAVEYWLAQKCGAFICKYQEDAAMALHILDFMNSLKEATLKVIDVCIKVVARSAIKVDESIVVTACRRLLRLAAYLHKLDLVLPTVAAAAKVFAASGKGGLALAVLEACAGLLDGEQRALPTTPDCADGIAENAAEFLRSELLVLPKGQASADADHVAALADAWATVAVKAPGDVRIPKDNLLLLRIIRLLPRRMADPSPMLARIAEQTRSADVLVECHLALLGTRNAIDHSGAWEQKTREHGEIDSTRKGTFQCLSLLWRYVGKRDTADAIEAIRTGSRSPIAAEVLDLACVLLRMLGNSDVALLLRPDFELFLDCGRLEEAVACHAGQGGDTDASAALCIESARCVKDLSDGAAVLTRCKNFYLEGKMAASYRLAVEHFEDLLTGIRSSKDVTLRELWQQYCSLMMVVEWLVFICDVGGCWRLVRYYLKAGLSYAESIRAPRWREKFTMLQAQCHRRAGIVEVEQSSRVRINASLSVPVNAPLSVSSNVSSNVPSSVPVNALPNTLSNTLSSKTSPPSIWGIPAWIDEQTTLLQPPSVNDLPSSLAIFRANSPSLPVDEPDALLDWTWKCGNSCQFRRLACARLLGMSDAGGMALLMGAVRRKEFFVLSNDPDSGLLDTPFTAGAANAAGLLVDCDRSLLYVSLSSCRVLSGGPIVLRIRMVPAFETVRAALLAIIEDNKKALFKPGAAPTDEDSKRTWWQGRYDLQVRLARIVEQMDECLKAVAVLLYNGDTERCGRGPGVVAPADVQVNVLISALRAAKLETSESVPLLLALGFTRDDAETLSLPTRTLSRGAAEPSDNPFDPFTALGGTGKSPLYLALDRYLHEFPWEASTSLRRFALLRCLGHGAGPSCAKYESISAVLNPSGDLKRTESQLRPLLDEIKLQDIVVGTAPSKGEMQKILGSSDLALYFGHGSGELYLPATEIAALPRCAVAFLFGCSSGGLRACGEYNPEGALLAFRTAGSPLILANLWDVTDRDIDKLTEAFLRKLPLIGVELPVRKAPEECSEALEASRSACLLRLLNGAAPVLFAGRRIDHV